MKDSLIILQDPCCRLARTFDSPASNNSTHAQTQLSDSEPPNISSQPTNFSDCDRDTNRQSQTKISLRLSPFSLVSIRTLFFCRAHKHQSTAQCCDEIYCNGFNLQDIHKLSVNEIHEVTKNSAESQKFQAAVQGT